MPLLLVDMDDSLVDRTATLHRWADRHLPVPVPAADHPLWHGLARFGVHRLVSRLAALYERSAPRSYRLEEGVREALEEVRRTGWSIAVITNGNHRTQPAKLASVGVLPLVDAVVISSHERFAKPDAASGSTPGSHAERRRRPRGPDVARGGRDRAQRTAG